jgi:hypothetical protein
MTARDNARCGNGSRVVEPRLGEVPALRAPRKIRGGRAGQDAQPFLPQAQALEERIEAETASSFAGRRSPWKACCDAPLRLDCYASGRSKSRSMPAKGVPEAW